jgi:hypothetical protein
LRKYVRKPSDSHPPCCRLRSSAAACAHPRQASSAPGLPTRRNVARSGCRESDQRTDFPCEDNASVSRTPAAHNQNVHQCAHLSPPTSPGLSKASRCPPLHSLSGRGTGIKGFIYFFDGAESRCNARRRSNLSRLQDTTASETCSLRPCLRVAPSTTLLAPAGLVEGTVVNFSGEAGRGASAMKDLAPSLPPSRASESVD